MADKAASGKKNSFTMEVPPKKKYLSKVRKFLEEVLKEEHPLSETKLQNLQLCVSEALVNSIREHESIKSSKHILIKLDLLGDHIAVEVKDKGKGFDTKRADLSLQGKDLEEAGMGLQLIKEFSDECTIKSSNKGTSIRVCIFE